MVQNHFFESITTHSFIHVYNYFIKNSNPKHFLFEYLATFSIRTLETFSQTRLQFYTKNPIKSPRLSLQANYRNSRMTYPRFSDSGPNFCPELWSASKGFYGPNWARTAHAPHIDNSRNTLNDFSGWKLAENRLYCPAIKAVVLCR